MQPQAFTCSRCNAPLPPGVIQCPNCGLAFAAPVPAGGMRMGYGAPAAKRTPTVVVVLIILAVAFVPTVAILSAILFPVFAKARDQARETGSLSNLKQIGIATLAFSQDHHDRLPPLDTMDHFKTALQSYIHPSQGYDPFVETGMNVPYGLNAKASSLPMSAISNSSKIPLAWETVPHSDGRTAVLYADGHVEMHGQSDPVPGS